MGYANAYGFDANHVIDGEFGLWHGTWTSPEAGSYTFTDQDSRNYATYYYQAAEDAGFKISHITQLLLYR